jgi:hypothetical protein
VTRWWTCLLLVVAPPASAEDALPPVRMTIHPQAEPVPALKYQLLPTPDDQQPGNAAVLYHRAILMRSQLRTEPEQDLKEADWLTAPVSELPRAEVRKAVAKYAAVLREIDLAAHRRQTDWQLEGRGEGPGLMLPEIQGMRSLATGLALKARLEIAEGQYDLAVRTLGNGFAMARQVSEGPLLLQPLVGFAIADLMLRQVQDLVQQPGAPNLYWALTSLPRPLIDLREALRGERALLVRQFPDLRRLRSERLTVAEARTLVERVVSRAFADDGRKSSPWERRVLIAYWTAKLYPAAKRSLREQGRRDPAVEAMPAVQAVAILLLRHYDRVADELLKWYAVPYWQGRTGMARTVQELRRDEGALESGFQSFYGLLFELPRVYAAGPQRDRHVAALRCVEALRLYAADHRGAAPGSLADLGVPVPTDPITGRGFGYSVLDGKVILAAPTPPGDELYVRGFRLEISVAR